MAIGQDGHGFMADAVGRVIRELEAGLAATQGHHEQAALAYDSLLATRLSTGHRFAHAVLTVDAASALPPELVPEGAIETARLLLDDLGAVPLLARLDAGVRSATEAAST